MDLLLVEGEAVLPPAVLVELLAVVGGQHDQGVAQHVGRDGIDQPADEAVGVVDLAVVEGLEVLGVPRRIERDLPRVDPLHVAPRHAGRAGGGLEGRAVVHDLRIVVGIVGIDVVDVEEERLVAVRLQPGEHPPVDRRRVRLVVVGRRLAGRAEEGLEAAGETVPRVEDPVAEEAAGLVAAPRHRLGQGRDPRRDAVGRGVVAEELARLAAGHERDHRRQGPGRLGVGVLHHDPRPRQGAGDVGRGVAPVAVGSQVVVAQGVDQDEEDVRALRRRSSAPTAGPAPRPPRCCAGAPAAGRRARRGTPG